MESKFVNINVKSLNDNVFKLLDNDWMLITAGNTTSYNTMTASWGSFGILWNKPIAICFIRPQRHTMKFINQSEFFTLTFYSDAYKNILNYCGSHSGKSTDKIKDTGLDPITTERGNIAFSQARLILECRKLYADQFREEHFLSKSLVQSIYPRNDFHHFFVGEIINCYTTEPILMEKYSTPEENENDTF